MAGNPGPLEGRAVPKAGPRDLQLRLVMAPACPPCSHGRIPPSRAGVSVFGIPGGLKLICTSNKAQLESTRQNCPPNITQLCVYFIAKKIQPWLAPGSVTASGLKAHLTPVC